MPEPNGYVTWKNFLLVGVPALVATAVFILTIMGFTYSAHKEQPHAGAATMEDLRPIRDDIGALRREVHEMYLEAIK